MKEKNEVLQNYHVLSDAVNDFGEETVLSVFTCMSRARKFEECIVNIVDAGKGDIFHVKVHMSSGQEAVSAALAVTLKDYQYFIQHRSMDLYLALGAPPERLRDEILCLDTGCSHGKQGGGFCCFENGIHLYGHTGFIGENVSVGVGAALGNRKNTVCFFGDGAAEEDYVLESYGFAATHHLPVLFVCTDNNLSVLSPVQKRRSWNLAEVAKGFGLETVDLADDPFTLMKYLRSFKEKMPALLNCRVNRIYWHAGTGIDGPPKWDRYEIVKKQLDTLGYGVERKQIEKSAEEEMRRVWKNYL